MSNLQEQENYNREGQFSQDNVSRDNTWESPLANSFANEERNTSINRNVFDQEDTRDKEAEVDENDSEDLYPEDEDDDDENAEDDFDDDEDEDDGFQEDDLNDADEDRNNSNPANPRRF